MHDQRGAFHPFLEINSSCHFSIPDFQVYVLSKLLIYSLFPSLPSGTFTYHSVGKFQKMGSTEKSATLVCFATFSGPAKDLFNFFAEGSVKQGVEWDLERIWFLVSSVPLITVGCQLSVMQILTKKYLPSPHTYPKEWLWIFCLAFVFIHFEEAKP